MLDAKQLLPSFPTTPVYRMLDADRDVLYVGKARNLRKRLQSYFRVSGQPPKVLSMMRQVAAIETTVTHTENEALLLENNLIKTLHPRYNILLRDDKSYPYIFISDGEPFPRASAFTGAPSAPKVAILVRIRPRHRCATVCTCCKRCFWCVSAKTAFFVTARGRVFNTRSSGALGPASASLTLSATNRM